MNENVTLDKEGDDGLKFPSSGREMLLGMCAMYGYTLSEFEALMWGTQILNVYTDEQIIRACIAHMEGPEPARNFMPKYGELKALIDPQPGFLEIERAVRECGPYQTPVIDNPVLVEAISLLGGWERVCAEMPDSHSRPIDFLQYQKRVDTALATARKRVAIEGHNPRPLLGIVQRQEIEKRQAQHQLGYSPDSSDEPKARPDEIARIAFSRPEQ